MTLRERWRKTSVANQGLVITGGLVAFGTIFYALAAVVQIHLLKKSSAGTDIQIQKIITAVNEIAGSANTANQNNQAALERTLAQMKAQADASNIVAANQESQRTREAKC